MANQKHLTAEQRSSIQDMLSRGLSFTEIGVVLDKDPSTVSKEIRNHITFLKVGYRYVKFNACLHRSSCNKINVCTTCKPDRNYKKCSNCPACNSNCKDFVEVICPKLLKPPYVCNGCSDRHGGCTLEKRYYYADSAHKEYLETLSESRAGLSLSEEDVRHLDEIISPLVQQSQSPHHICVTNKDSIMVSESTISY
ncbi:MAG: helix-turn-helix domain-containing protein [Lachnospiraceae bacterium]|nr:helix-turn-helix domain-containing protein [Lachnospiraceae bacterium]